MFLFKIHIRPQRCSADMETTFKTKELIELFRAIAIHLASMIPSVLIVLVTLWIGLEGASGQPAPSNRGIAAYPAASAKFTASQMQADFDLTRSALEELHAGLYRYSTKSALDKAFIMQRTKLNRPMTKMEFLELMSDSLALIHCGHTSIHLDGATKAELVGAEKFPFRVLIEGNCLMVSLNDTPDDQRMATLKRAGAIVSKRTLRNFTGRLLSKRMFSR